MYIQAYLEHGDVDEEGFINENVEWVEYWRNLYPKVTIENIEKYKKKYQNSEEEKTELLDAYKKHKVDFQFYGWLALDGPLFHALSRNQRMFSG